MFYAVKRHSGLVLAIILVLLVVSLTAAGTATVGATKTGVLAAANDIPILNYHKVDTLYHALSISPNEFEEQMAYLHDNGYHTITPDQLLDYIQHGKSLPQKPIMLTFDDGYLDNYKNAYPIMKKYGFTATVFIVSSFIGQDARFMTWDQAREMQSAGFVFGSHTAHHLNLTTISGEQAWTELTDSRIEIERQLGQVPQYFAYPTGHYNAQIEELVSKAGYKAAFTVRYGQAGSQSDLYAMERIPIFKGHKTFRSFFIRLNGAPVLERLGAIKS